MGSGMFDMEMLTESMKNITIARQYDLRTEITGRTESFTKNEIKNAKNIALEYLEREGIEKYSPKLILIDNKNEQRIIVIFAIPDEEYMCDGIESRGRTFHIHDGKFINIIKGKCKIDD